MSDEKKIKVPLVVYILGERHVIGEAEIEGEHVRATLGDSPMSDEILDLFASSSDKLAFSLDYVEGPKLYPPVIEEIAAIPPLGIQKFDYPGRARELYETRPEPILPKDFKLPKFVKDVKIVLEGESNDS